MEEEHSSPEGPQWAVQCHACVGSTNDVCRSLPPWSAALAETQTQGRGRFGRAFVSGVGGLWLSAVLPAPGPPEKWAGFSLRVGATLLSVFRRFDVPEVRLRWPNDIMCGDKKLAGLLIEQPATGTLIVGLGVNVTNEPWLEAPELRDTATSLAEWIKPPEVDHLARLILNALAGAQRKWLDGGMRAAIKELNESWESPIPVEISLSSGETVKGSFTGLDAYGHLRVKNAAGAIFRVEHQQVERLRECGA